MIDKVNFLNTNKDVTEIKQTQGQIIFKNPKDEFVKSERSKMEQEKLKFISEMIGNITAYKDMAEKITNGRIWGDEDGIIGFVYKDDIPIEITANKYDYNLDEKVRQRYSFEDFSKIMKAISVKLSLQNPEYEQEFSILYDKIEQSMQKLSEALQDN